MSIKIFDKNLLDEAEKFSSASLNCKDDLQLIIDYCLTNDLYKEFEDLAFTGKYIEGLKRVLSKGSEFQEIENLDYVKKDLTSSMEKIVGQMKSILSNPNKSTLDHFENTYFSLTQESFQNLNKLTADLELVKKYLNFLKRVEN